MIIDNSKFICNMKILTSRETAEITLVETQNELTKQEVMERLLIRLSIKDARSQQALSATQAKIRALKESLRHLEDIHRDEVEKEEKDATLKK